EEPVAVPPVRTGAEWVNTFVPGPCSTAIVNLAYRGKNAIEFQVAMALRQNPAVFNWGENDVWEADFRSPAFGHGGHSLDWIDDVHFGYLATHGSQSGTLEEGPNTRYFVCFATQRRWCVSASSTWRLGEKSLKWMVFDTCDLVAGTDAHFVHEWFAPMRGVHMVFGFVGTTADSTDVGWRFGFDVANRHRLGDAWLSNAWSDPRDYSSTDPTFHITPIVIAAGATKEEAVARRDHETIDYLRVDVQATNWLAWKWYY
ncbi:MAG: DUF6345 domain-containing protein, partial [Gaiellaceae bacterium]